jgi:hypothetical protein
VSRPLAAGGVLIVGLASHTHVGGSLHRAAARLGIRSRFIDMREAESPYRWVNSLYWRLAQKLPARVAAFEARLLAECETDPPALLVTTGRPPLRRPALDQLAALGVPTINYSTDDPWNPAHRADWHLAALPGFAVVATPRTANLAQFRALGCRAVHQLPFGYDEGLLDESVPTDFAAPPELLFVGGADPDRHAFFDAWQAADGPRPALVGAYWKDTPRFRDRAYGGRSPAELVWLTRNAAVSLILVRRANRDGHVMRSFEAAAAGGCLLVEDTAEHRAIFGPDGDTVRYFSDPAHGVAVCRDLLTAPATERERLRQAVQRRIVAGAHTYADRLRQMLALAGVSDSAG